MIPFILPGTPGKDFRIMQRFNDKVDYTTSGIHGALDIAPAKPGTKNVVIYAPHEGYVGVASGGMLGNHVRVTSLPYTKEGDTRETLVAHCEKFLVKEGDYVAQGMPIAIMGTTGFSTGIHAHWEYRVNGKLTDVEKYLFTWLLPK
jgi:murein DD-endopeptidase MepM/ murein hydrolase activator NlpD